MSYEKAKESYKSSTVLTASPQRMLVMLYERLIKDLDDAAASIYEQDYFNSNRHLIHAQDIIIELLDSLNLELWPAGAQLGELYRFCWNELVNANVKKDAGIVKQVRELLDPLRDAWQQAEKMMATQ